MMKHLDRYRTRAACFLLLVALSSAQMVEFDLPPGEFMIECTKGSACVFGENSTFTLINFGPTDPPVLEQSSLSTSTAYFFREDGGYISGVECISESMCFATCDEACTCFTDPTNIPVVGEDNSTSFSLNSGGLSPDNPNVTACSILATLPDVSIATPDEYVTYQSTVQGPEARISFRCVDEFAVCSTVSLGNEYFTVVTNPAEATEFYYARDFQYCGAPPGYFCYISCDPRCECQEYNEDGESEDCTTGNPPVSLSPTASPSASSSAGTPIPSAATCTAGLVPAIVTLFFGFINHLVIIV